MDSSLESRASAERSCPLMTSGVGAKRNAPPTYLTGAAPLIVPTRLRTEGIVMCLERLCFDVACEHVLQAPFRFAFFASRLAPHLLPQMAPARKERIGAASIGRDEWCFFIGISADRQESISRSWQLPDRKSG